MPNISRRAFLQLCLPMVLAACAAPATEALQRASTPTAAPAGTDALQRASTPTPVAEAPPAATAPVGAAPTLAPTPACGDDDDDPTPAQTEGPYYTPNTPARASLLEPGMAGTRLVVSGQVLTTGCQPVAGALLDFWHADDAGVYDNAGYRLRGHQFADDQGQYQLETIVPGLYPGRTRHIHVKVQAPNGPVLTTQLYFPDEAANASDGIYAAALVMTVDKGAEGWTGQFNFVLEG